LDLSWLSQIDEALVMAGSVKEFTDGNWKSEVLDSPIPVVVDFWAPWCRPCQMLTPTIEKLAGEYEGKIKVGKMNTDENQETPGSLRISAIPTVIFFHEGREVDKLVGVSSESKFREKLREKFGVS
jgi:thioredoxin 1